MARNKKFQDKEQRLAFKKPRLGLERETKRGITVVVFILIALISVLSLARLAGSFGNFLLTLLTSVFGKLAYLVPLLFLLVALALYRQELDEDKKDHSFYLRTYLGATLLSGSVAGLIHIFHLNNNEAAFAVAQSGIGGGFLGALFSLPVFSLFGFLTGSVVLFALFIIGVLVTFNISIKALLPKFSREEGGKEEKTKTAAEVKINTMGTQGFVEERVPNKNRKADIAKDDEDEEDEGEDEDGEEKISVPAKKPAINQPAAVKPQMESIQLADRKDWKLPGFDLLEDSGMDVDSGNIEVNMMIIKKTLADFGIEAEMGEVNVGPTVTQYTLRPATGVKLSQIAALQDNLSLELAAKSIRMELPIPGKSLVGIEVPNKSTAIVRLRSVLATKEFVDHKSKLAVALGRDVAGHPQVSDLAKMPHLLVAGATGTGKSVAINSLFISLLYRNTPQDVKFIVVDPKRVELNLYNGIPHLLTPVVTETEKAVNALKWAVAEMDRRYKLLAEVGKRNIIEYNSDAGLPMPYIVIIVDELADLMAVAQADVEAAIVRLAQMARAVGIHLVLATQRPSVDIITGLIKANITSRIAFAVASQIDSRTILDTAGAEKLLGNGDMLYTSAEFNKPRRVQGAYIGEKEVKKVVEFFKTQVGAVIYNEEILEKPKKALGVPGFESGGDDEDPLLEEAAQEVRRAGKASASLLQRRLKVGYARAARLLDIMEQKGIVGPGEGAKPREVYGVVPPDEKAEYGIEADDQQA